MSVPRIVSSKYKFNAGSRTNLIVIKPEKCKINEQKQFLKLGLLNIRSLTPKAVIVNEIITDNSFDVLCLTETWLKTNDYFGLNESTPPSYCYKHEPRQTGRGGGVATIYSDILNVTQKTGYRFDSFEILMLNVKLSDKQNKSVLSLALATVYRPPGPYTDFLKEFADFLSDLLVNVDKALIGQCKYVLSICKLFYFYFILFYFFWHCLEHCKCSSAVFLHCLSICKLFVVFLHCLSICKLLLLFFFALSGARS